MRLQNLDEGIDLFNVVIVLIALIHLKIDFDIEMSDFYRLKKRYLSNLFLRYGLLRKK